MTVLLVCLAIITAIPFFHRGWVNRSTRTDAQIKSQQTWLSLLNFFCLFLGAFSFKLQFGVAVQALFFASVLSFGLLYRKAEPKPASPSATLRASSVQLGFLMIVLGICLMKPWAILVIPFTLPWVMPLLIRLQFDCTPLQRSTLKTAILYTFEREHIPVKEIMILNHPRPDYKNAFTCGKVLFISLSLFESLTLNELSAVILHEGAHLKLHHFVKRIWASIGYLMLAAVCIVIPANVLLPSNPLVMFVSGAAAVFLQFYWLGRTIHRQEHQADLVAMQCGANGDALISALVKISPPAPPVPSLWMRLISGNHHPTLSERIDVIQSRQKFPIQTALSMPDEILRKEGSLR